MEKENAVQCEIKPSGAMPSGFYNMDCMEAMKRFPDKFFDLAIVDPPYGDALDGTGGGTTGSADSSTSTNRWQRFGQRFDRYKLDKVQPCRMAGKICPDRGGQALREPVEPGQVSTGKKS